MESIVGAETLILPEQHPDMHISHIRSCFLVFYAQQCFFVFEDQIIWWKERASWEQEQLEYLQGFLPWQQRSLGEYWNVLVQQKLIFQGEKINTNFIFILRLSPNIICFAVKLSIHCLMTGKVGPYAYCKSCPYCVYCKWKWYGKTAPSEASDSCVHKEMALSGAGGQPTYM